MKFEELGILGASLEECFYCGNSLPAKNKEHVFNSCLGGVHKTSHLICDKCNLFFADIDDAFAPLACFVMNAWSFKGERHNKIPEIRLEDYTLMPGAKPKMKEPKLDAVPMEDQSFKIHLTAKSKTEARKLLLDGELERLIGRPLTEEQRTAILEGIQSASKQEKEIGPQAIPLEINPQKEYRSVAHILLKSLALVQPGFLQSNLALSIRNFARYNKGNWKEFAVDVHQNILSREEAERVLGVQFNLAEIYFSGADGIIVGVLTILGRIVKSVIIGHGYKGPDKLIAIYEDSIGSGIIRGVSFEMKEKCPLFSIAGQISEEQLVKDAQDIVNRSITQDAVLAELKNGLSRVFKKYTKVTCTCVDECEELLCQLVKNVGRVQNREINEAEIKTSLKEGLDYLVIDYIGKECSNPSVQGLLMDTLGRTLERFFK